MITSCFEKNLFQCISILKHRKAGWLTKSRKLQSSISKTILPNSTLSVTQERSLSASKQQRTYQYHETINRVTDNRCTLGFVAAYKQLVSREANSARSPFLPSRIPISWIIRLFPINLNVTKWNSFYEFNKAISSFSFPCRECRDANCDPLFLPVRWPDCDNNCSRFFFFESQVQWNLNKKKKKAKFLSMDFFLKI